MVYKGHDSWDTTQNYCIIDRYNDYQIRLPKLNIGYKDFLYHCSSSWLNAEEDNLDTMLALQLVSCPSSFYGVGGIGAAAAKISKGKLSTAIIPELNNTYKTIVAENFQTMQYLRKNVKIFLKLEFFVLIGALLPNCSEQFEFL